MAPEAHTDKIFDVELTSLRDKLLEMGGKVEAAIAASVRALIERDSALAEKVKAQDREINRLEVDIDDMCRRLLALRQPAASDLRFITTALKIVVDLERMGDLAVDICERTIELLDEPQLKPYIDIPRMAEAAQKMLKDSLDAFVSRDAELAMKVCEADDFVDNLNQQIFNELLVYMLQDPKNIARAVRLTYITKYLERVGDHATNIAEMVVYMVKGKVIRHMACEMRSQGPAT